MNATASRHRPLVHASASRAARCLALALAFALAPAVRTAAAQPAPVRTARQTSPGAPSALSQQRAQYLLDEALRDRNNGLLERAETRLRLAVVLWDYPVLRYHLAIVQVQRGDPVAAARNLQRVLRANAALLARHPHLRELTEQRLRELDARALAKVTLACRTEGARLYIGDAHVHTVERGPCRGRTCLKMTAVRDVAAKPGAAPHLLVAVMPHGDPPVVVEQQLVPGRSYLVSFDQRRAGRRWRHLTWEPWAAIGTGAALGLASAALHEHASASYRAFEQRLAACTAGAAACDPSPFDHLRRRGDTLRTLGIVGYSVGATAAVAGAALFYLNRRVAYRRKDLTIAPLVEHAGAGALVSGRF